MRAKNKVALAVELSIDCGCSLCIEPKYEKIENFHLKIIVFTAVKNCRILPSEARNCNYISLVLYRISWYYPVAAAAQIKTPKTCFLAKRRISVSFQLRIKSRGVKSILYMYV